LRPYVPARTKRTSSGGGGGGGGSNYHHHHRMNKSRRISLAENVERIEEMRNS
jgi:hypothetical protein